MDKSEYHPISNNGTDEVFFQFRDLEPSDDNIALMLSDDTRNDTF